MIVQIPEKIHKSDFWKTGLDKLYWIKFMFKLRKNIKQLLLYHPVHLKICTETITFLYRDKFYPWPLTSWVDNHLELSVLHWGDQCTNLDVYKANICHDIEKTMSFYVISCLTFELVVQNKIQIDGITVTASTCTPPLFGLG